MVPSHPDLDLLVAKQHHRDILEQANGAGAATRAAGRRLVALRARNLSKLFGPFRRKRRPAPSPLDRAHRPLVYAG